MNCEQVFCLYQRGGFCLCEVVQVNGLGLCEDCILVHLEEDYLEEEKERQLQAILAREAQSFETFP